MARQWVILGQRNEPLHDGSGLPPENRNGRIVNARVHPTGTAEGPPSTWWKTMPPRQHDRRWR